VPARQLSWRPLSPPASHPQPPAPSSSAHWGEGGACVGCVVLDHGQRNRKAVKSGTPAATWTGVSLTTRSLLPAAVTRSPARDAM
jgi:hypothetical protein